MDSQFSVITPQLFEDVSESTIAFRISSSYSIFNDIPIPIFNLFKTSTTLVQFQNIPVNIGNFGDYQKQLTSPWIEPCKHSNRALPNIQIRCNWLWKPTPSVLKNAKYFYGVVHLHQVNLYEIPFERAKKLQTFLSGTIVSELLKISYLAKNTYLTDINRKKRIWFY